MPPILILDGGLGTSLERKYNVKFGPSTPLWSSHLLVSDTDTLGRCQRDFGSVPVNILLTATYQVSIEGFKNTKTPSAAHGIEPDLIPSYLNSAVSIAEEASRGTVALSLGPYGACMIPSQEYSGRYDDAHSSLDSLYAWHKERIQLFMRVRDISRRVGFLALETIPRVDEIFAMRMALDLALELSEVPFWMSCLFPGDDGYLPSGESAEDALRAMFDTEVARVVPWGVGINCTKVGKLDSILRRYEATIGDMFDQGLLKEWPALVLYPDGTNGEVYNTTTQVWEMPADASSTETASWEEQLESVVRGTESRGRWKQIVVGGCCMADADDISRLRARLMMSGQVDKQDPSSELDSLLSHNADSSDKLNIAAKE